MDEQERVELKRRLLQYPGATADSVESDLYAYEQRENEKRALISERRMSNALAETVLDRKGYPRPPGWHSVFFYPGSNRPRNRMLLLVGVASAVYWFFTR